MNDQLVIEFVNKLIENLDGLIKAIIWFGSTVKDENKDTDIDLLVIVDDIYAMTTNTTVSYYFDTLNKLLSDEKYKKFHITTLTLTKFWEMVKDGDPLILDILRKGVPMIDPAGIFSSFKKMLEMGMIKTSPEYLDRMNRNIENYMNFIDYYLIKAFESLYNAVVLTAQYFMSKNNIDVYSPEDILIKFNEIKNKYKIPKKTIEYYREVYSYMKKIMHKEIDKVDLLTLKDFIERFPEYRESLNK